MKRFTVITALSLLFLTGCGSNNSEVASSDPEVLYEQACLACHGSNLQGAAGPAVTNMASKFTAEEVKTLIMDGVGMMPGDTLTEEQADIVTEWLMEK
ncbi:cytochrome c551/cytochrome c550 [Mesobacillus persicus]|uniref:Cytochrome c551/cytochrome c550 n=1 Tax=Mesobacillus persicus TaxID=930146 RepID=A0A1H8KRT1_9BACI|nr:cytochrome c [Mesobacillus persicus]SEN95584.1 cytochrome c551/cytochrome c550 [Mesobacillus persicus]